jgi:hypothetical protein
MNKKAKRRVVAVFVVVCSMYAVAAFKLHDRIGMSRVSADQGMQSKSMDVLAPGERPARHPVVAQKPLQEPEKGRRDGESDGPPTEREAVSPGDQPAEGKQGPAAAVRGREEWDMPNLLHLPMRTAVERLSPHTGRIRVMGSGDVVEQHPRSTERVRGEAECILYGRTFVR